MKKSKKQMVCMMLALVLVLSAVLAGCGNKTGQPSSDKTAAAGDTSSAGSSDGEKKADSGSYPTLTWYLPGDPTVMTSEGYEAVSAEVNKYLEEKLGCHLEVKLFAFSEYNQKCSTVLSAGEHFDLMFTSDWLNNFASNAGSNAFLPLNDLLEANAPDAMKEIPEYMWGATTINGNIYAMPALQVYAKNDGVFFRKDIAEEFDIKGSSYENGVDTYTLQELGDIYARIKEKYPNLIPDDSESVLWMRLDEAYGFNYLGGFDVPGVVRFSDESKVENQFKSNEFMGYCKTIYDWVQKGYLQPDFASYVTQTDQQSIDRKSPDHMTYRQGFCAPSVASMSITDCKWTETPVPVILSKKYATTSGVTQSLTAVGVNSEHPELAVQLYNLVFTDEWLFNTLLYGIEGVNYTKVSDTEITINRESNYAAPLASFTMANQFNSWIEQGTGDPKQWEIAKQFCEDATPSKLFGFIFDSSAVQNEVANCSAIYSEYQYPLLCGAVDPEEIIPQLNERLDQAGADKILKEMQRQVDEFLAK